jgi:hypothetical protein
LHEVSSSNKPIKKGTIWCYPIFLDVWKCLEA